jgi:hypothetical protein
MSPPKILPNRQIPMDTPTRISFQQFTSNLPISSFKTLVVLTPRLLRGLHAMSLAKTVPEGIRDKECKRFALGKHPLVLYVPEKDPIQEIASALKRNQSLKTIIWDDAELCISIWHAGTRETFFMHVSTALDAIEKRGPFKAYKEACEAYVKQQKVAKQAKAALAILYAAVSVGEKASKKTSKKTSKKAFEKASQKAKEGAALVDVPDPELCAEYKKDLEKAKEAAETTKNKKEATAK